MTSNYDYEALRDQIMGGGKDEAVTVNTRALIDKVLARYSGEWTTLRELIQNAADASSTKVIIRFLSLPSATIPVPQSVEPSARLKHVLLHHTVKTLIVENNGVPFKAIDWSRLKKIAEGNPDETKIGAFGVGFYSVFADCEEPFVSSGKEALAFYWRGDSLFTKTLHLDNTRSENTTFILPMRNSASPIPSLLSLCRFLTSSLTFVGLESIELWLDDWKIMELNKLTAPEQNVDIPHVIDKTTPEGLMEIGTVTREAAQFRARYMKAVEWKPETAFSTKNLGQDMAPKGAHPTQSLRSFFSRLAPGIVNVATEKAAKEELVEQNMISEDLVGVNKATLFLHIMKANVNTIVTKIFSKELERATKKPPPKTTTISLLTVSYDEHTVSTSASSPTGQTSNSPDLFQSVVPKKGKIFIGFSTNQTTGLDAHISAPSAIPTVEREAIDLNNRFVRTWNVELLRVAGVLTRIAWSSEMAHLKKNTSKSMELEGRGEINKDGITQALPEASFLHKTFNFVESTPSSEIGSIIEQAFWTCNEKTSIEILSSRGVVASSSVRVSPESLGFVDRIPMLLDELAGFGLVKRLRDYGIITDITISDIKSELEKKALDVQQLQQLLEWIGHKTRTQKLDSDAVRSLLSVTVAHGVNEASGIPIILGNIKNYLNVAKIPADMPIPSSTIPFQVSRKMNRSDLDALGWDDLQLVPWLRWLVGAHLSPDQDLEKSPLFAKKVLPVLSKQWDGLSQVSKSTVIELMSSRTVVPTKLGMRRPADSYFPSVNLFDDLPVVINLQSVKDRFLLALGVRKTIEIGVVFDRLMAVSPALQDESSVRWGHVDLIKYLASVGKDIPSADIQRLKSTPICPTEGNKTGKRYIVSDLFEPEESLRRLMLPILQWPGPYNSQSAEGRFLSFLGLRTSPNYLELIEIISRAGRVQDVALRNHAFKYFIDNYHTKGYENYDHANVSLPYLPLESSNELEKPTACFTNNRAAVMGFHILKKELHVDAYKFGVRPDPPIQECIDRLLKGAPKTKEVAREIFEYFAARTNEIDRQSADTLSGASIVPIFPKPTSCGSELKREETLRYVPPRTCFLGNDERYEDILDYVDFGQKANTFLLHCGSKHEPSTSELAAIVMREPAKMFTTLGIQRYIELLRKLAESWPNLKKNKDLVKIMKVTRFLLAYRELPSGSKGIVNGDEDDQSVRTAELATAREIVIIDDTITYNQFKSSLLAAPLEEALENFYYNLGAPELGSLVEENHTIGLPLRSQRPALELQKLVQERTKLYLHDFTPEVIKHNSEWIENHLSVILVHSILLRKTLRGHNRLHRESRTAAVNAHQGGYKLSVISEFDLFEVSQVLVPLLLNRYKTQQIMMLEMILSTDLRKLQSRGYNVQRILRQKAAEARIAEEARQRQLAQETQNTKDREASWNKQNAEITTDTQKQDSMPGLFPESPDHKLPDHLHQSSPPEIDRVVREPRGFFSSVGQRLLDSGRRSLPQGRPTEISMKATEDPANDDLPPPYSPGDRQHSHPPAHQPEVATAPYRLQQNLISAIQAARAHNSSDVTSQPAVNEVKETHSYCDAKPGQNITFVGEVLSLRIFLAKTIAVSSAACQKFLAANVSALSSFAQVLLDCASVFSIRRESLHLFYDQEGSTIAFNQNKALFFNYRYFENLHLPEAQQGKVAEAVVYWFVVMAHELAHNLITDHSADHSYYTEALIVQYFAKIATRIAPSTGSASTSRLPQDGSEQRRRHTPRSMLDVE